jgi:streptomycin 6-kinase
MLHDLVPPDPKLSKTERLIERLKLAGSGPIQYYMGRGAIRYIDAELMKKANIAVFVQVLNERIKDESATQLIASHEYPALEIARMGHWEQL